MHHTLKLHPDSRCSAVTDIEVEVSRPRPDTLTLRYLVSGKTDELRLPPVTSPARRDELWQHTCLEAFVAVPTSQAYYEFNLAPSTAWAVYHFSGYRSGMSVADEISAPHIEVQSNNEGFQLQVSLDLSQLPTLLQGEKWRLGLSAVIEETNGRKSYWALAHPPGKPDFHHSDCFASELAATR